MDFKILILIFICLSVGFVLFGFTNENYIKVNKDYLIGKNIGYYRVVDGTKYFIIKEEYQEYYNINSEEDIKLNIKHKQRSFGNKID